MIIEAVLTGAAFVAGAVVGVYLCEKHGVTCAQVQSTGNQLSRAIRVTLTGESNKDL